MENFIVSARKYRPATFDTVVGQSSITNTLKNAIRNNHLAQAFLFAGPRGVGKTTCARILAKTINCFNPTENIEPCNECESCVSFNESASFNIHELDAASNNSVDDIRSLVDQVRIPPQVGKYKVYIIDEVHMLSQSAFNAFLKTLEEPPDYAKFILATTEKHKIIPTILSRCQIFDFRRISVPDIAQHLSFVANKEGVKSSDEALHIIAQRADGALRDALSIFDQLVSFGGKELDYDMVIEHLNVLDYTYYFNITDQILGGDMTNALLTLNEIIERGFDGQHFIIGLGEHLRNLLVCKDKATIELLEVSANVKEKYAEQSSKCTIWFLAKALEIQNQCDIEYKNSNNKRLNLELAILRLCTLEKSKPATPEKKNSIIDLKAEKKKAPPTKSTNNQLVNKPIVKKQPDKTSSRDNGSSGSPLTISIKPENHKEKKKTGTEPSAEEEKENFTEEQLNKVWKYYTESIARQYPNYYSTLKRRNPVLKKDYLIELVIDNKVQDMEIKERKPELLEFLKNELRNTFITIETRIVKSNEEGRPYLPEEKFRAMAKKNPLLKNLKDSLDLELDY
jgi:DNA polymerase-3 subunit gamma/tau